MKSKKGDQWKTFSTLVSSSFSLWRAAFLIPLKKSHKKFRQDTFALLEKLIKDNSIAFSDDRKLQEWMSGYYLRNCYLRLLKIKDNLKTTFDFDVEIYFEGFTELLKSNPKKCWDILFKCCSDLFFVLSDTLEVGNYEYGLKRKP